MSASDVKGRQFADEDSGDDRHLRPPSLADFYAAALGDRVDPRTRAASQRMSDPLSLLFENNRWGNMPEPHLHKLGS